MLIWLALIIPFLAILIMAIAFQKKMAIWEYFIIFLIPVIAIFIAKQVSIVSQTHTTEYWNAYLTHAEYYEPWSTWVHKTCERCHEDCTGSGEDRSCHDDCETYDCSYCDESGPKWIAYDNLGRSYNITQQKFNELCKIWNNVQKIEMNRSIVKHWNCGVDGEKYQTVYDNVFEHTQSITDKHTYENRIKCSRSVFNFAEVDTATKREMGLYDYVNNFDIFNYNPIYGTSDIVSEKRLAWWNAKLGAFKKVHMLILLFKNKPQEAGMYQEQYWKNGNKNEFILCIGINDSNNIQWTKTISWTEVDILKTHVEQSVLGMKFNLPEIVDTLALNVQRKFIKKSFDDFKYITVEPTEGAIIWTFIIVIVLTVGLCIFSVMNEWGRDNPFDVDDTYTRNPYTRRRY